MAKNQTQVDRWLKRLKNNRVAAAVIVASIAFAGVVQFTRGVGDLLDFMGRRTASDDNSQEKSAGLSARGATAATDAERFTTGEPSPCVTEGGSAAVRAYALAHVDPDGLALFVRQNANLFAVDGAAVKCLQLLSSSLRIPIGATPSLIPNSSGTTDDFAWLKIEDKATIAFSSKILASVLPAMASGDDAPYRASYPAATSAAIIAARAKKDPEVKKSVSIVVEEFVPSFENYVRAATTPTPARSGAR